jgi:hypothetical protein
VPKSTVLAVQALLHWTPTQCRRVLIRTDAGLGTDSNITRILTHNFQMLMKGYNGKRALAFAKQIQSADWYRLRDIRWIALVPNAPRNARRKQTLLLRWVTETGEIKHATLVRIIAGSRLAHDS